MVIVLVHVLNPEARQVIAEPSLADLPIAASPTPASIRKLDSIMVTVGDMRIDRSKFAHSEIDGFDRYPSTFVFDVFRECQLGSRKHADRNLGLTF